MNLWLIETTLGCRIHSHVDPSTESDAPLENNPILQNHRHCTRLAPDEDLMSLNQYQTPFQASL